MTGHKNGGNDASNTMKSLDKLNEWSIKALIISGIMIWTIIFAVAFVEFVL
jgi:hypothetical protein